VPQEGAIEKLLEKYDGGRVPDVEELLGQRVIETYLRGFAQMNLWPVALRVAATSYSTIEERWEYSHEISPRWLNWHPFCQELRSIEDSQGNRPFDDACRRCDIEHARRAEQAGKTISYLCHAGLIDLATPVVVEGVTVSTLCSGQYVPAAGKVWPPEWIFPGKAAGDGKVDAKSESRRRLEEAKRLLPGFDYQVHDMAKQGKEISPAGLKEILDGLGQAGGDLERLCERTLELEMQSLLAFFRGEINQACASTDKGTFWQKMGQVVDRIRSLVGAEEGFLITHESPGALDVEVCCVCGDSGKGRPGRRRLDMAKVHAALDGRGVWSATAEGAKQVFGSLVSSDRPRLVFKVLDQGLLVFGFNKECDPAHLSKRRGDVDYVAQWAADVGSAIKVELAREQLDRRARELEEAQQERDRFQENIAHELRSPVQTVRLASFRLKHCGSERERDEVVRRIERQVNRIDGMVERFWYTQLLLTGQLELNNKKVNVYEIVKEMAEDVVDSADPSDVMIQVDDDIKSWPPIRVDRDLFGYVVRNLLDNAVKYSSASSFIKVGAGKGTRGELRLEFGNRGIPIPQEDREKIFQRYYRTRKARQLHPSSSGIGLALVAEFGRRYNVPVELQSKELASDEALNMFRLILSPA
jgi:signal transduction histidine kinase